jgi:hypothetical protein
MTNRLNAYDLSAGPAARAVEEAKLRRQSRNQTPGRKPWEGPNDRVNPYCSVEVHAMIAEHKAREDAYVLKNSR